MPKIQQILLGLIFLIGVSLLLYRSDTPLLWEDEGEVALIATNINKFGLPRTWDGEFFITQEDGDDSKFINGVPIWSWHTWLPYYATALSFKLFGESTFTARLPHILAGFLVMIVYLLLSDRLSRGNTTAILFSLLLLVTNVLFHLYVRQARYYAFTLLFSLSSIYFFWEFLEKGKLRHAFLYLLSMSFNFHSNFVLSFALPLPLIVYSFLYLPLVFIRSKKLDKKALVLLVFNTIFLLQSSLWLVYFRPAHQGDLLGFYRYWGGINRITEKFYNYINLTNSFHFPIILILGILFLTFFKKRGGIKLEKRLVLLGIGIFTHLLVISYFLQFGQKYLLSLIPVFSLIMGYLLATFYQRSKVAAALSLVMFMFTNIPFLISERLMHPSYLFASFNIRSYIKDYFFSQGLDYRGPVEGIVYFFNSQGIDRANIYTDYEVDSLKFYFPSFHFIDRNLTFDREGKPHPALDLNHETSTMYYIPRSFWGDLKKIDECKRQIIRRDFIKHELPFFDLEWENLPDITYHKFTLDEDLPKLVIYEKRGGVDFDPCKKAI